MKGKPNMETLKIFRNEENLELAEVMDLFKKGLTEANIYKKSEIEQLAENNAKSPVDKFIITSTPDVEVAQGDILIWAEGTSMYNKEFPNLHNLEKTDRLVLQEGDSITGDHRIVPLKGSKMVVKKGVFTPSFLKGKNTWRDQDYAATVVESDKPFLIVHREHGNIALPSGKYMFCSQIDSENMSRMMD